MMTPQNIFHYLDYDVLNEFRWCPHIRQKRQKMAFEDSLLIMKIISELKCVFAIYNVRLFILISISESWVTSDRTVEMVKSELSIIIKKKRRPICTPLMETARSSRFSLVKSD